MKLALGLLFAIGVVAISTTAHAQGAKPASVVAAGCHPCPAPCSLEASDSFDIHLRNGSTLRNWYSAIRDTMSVLGKQEQAIHFYTERNGRCVDTIFPAASVMSVSEGGLGSMHAPLVVPIYPAREFRRISATAVSTSFLEITAIAGYGGTDTSSRAVGFKSVYDGIDVLANPFGSLFGERMALAIGGELLFEGGRMRIPAVGQLRYSFLGAESLADSIRYTDPCALGCAGSAHPPEPDSSFHEDPELGTVDSSVFLFHDRVIRQSAFRPFVFVEGSYIFNGSFTGAGQNPSINPNDYGQYFLEPASALHSSNILPPASAIGTCG